MSSYSESDELTGKRMWDTRWALLRRVRLGVVYHRKREWYYDTLDKATKAVAVIGATSALATIYGSGSGWDKAVQLAIVVTSTFALVLDWSNKARVHSDLAARYSRLDGAIAACGERDFSEEDLARWDQSFCEIEATEPPLLVGLTQLCQDEIEMAAGCDVEPDRVSFCRRFRAHFGFGVMTNPAKQAEPQT